MKSVSFSRIFTWTALLSLVLVYVILWTRMIQDVKVRTGSDFIGIYTFGRIARAEGFHRIYDFEAQERTQEEMLGFQTTPEYYAHVPYVAVPAYLVTDADYVASFRRWSALLLLLNTLNVYVLVRTLPADVQGRAGMLLLYAAAFIFYPTFSGFMNGQDDAILLLGAGLWTLALLRGKPLLAGLALGLTTVRPQIALFLAIPFLFRHRRVFWGFAAGSSALALISLALIGPDGLRDFFASLRAVEASTWVQPHALDMPSVLGWIRRNFELTRPEPFRALVWALYMVGIFIFGFVWTRSRAVTRVHVGLLTLFSLLLVPYAHYHDLTLLLIPLFCLLGILQQRQSIRPEQMAVLPLAASVITLFGFAGSGGLKFTAVYFVMAMLAYFLARPDRLERLLKAREPADQTHAASA